MKTAAPLALSAALLAAPLGSAAPLVRTVVTVDQLESSGVAGSNPVPVFGRFDGEEALFLNTLAGDRLLRASVGGGVALDVLFGETPAPDTGNPLLFGSDWGFVPGGFSAGSGEAFVLGGSRRTQPDGPLTGGVYTHAEPGDPLVTFVNEDGGGLPNLPRRYAFGDGSGTSGFVLGFGTGANEGAYLRVGGLTTRAAARGDAYLNAPGVTAQSFDGNRFDVGGRTLAAVIEGSDGRDRLTAVSPGNGGALRSLLAADDVITDATGDRLRVNFFNGLVAEGAEAYARLSVEDLDAPSRDDEREALVRVNLVTGAVEVLDRTDDRLGQLGGGFDFLRGGLATEGGTVAYQVSGEGQKDVFFADGGGPQRLLGVGDDFLEGVLTDLDFVDGSLSGGELLFTGQYRLGDGTFRTGLFTAQVPEPATGLFLLGLLAAGGRRRPTG